MLDNEYKNCQDLKAAAMSEQITQPIIPPESAPQGAHRPEYKTQLGPEGSFSDGYADIVQGEFVSGDSNNWQNLASAAGGAEHADSGSFTWGTATGSHDSHPTHEPSIEEPASQGRNRSGPAYQAYDVYSSNRAPQSNPLPRAPRSIASGLPRIENDSQSHEAQQVTHTPFETQLLEAHSRLKMPPEVPTIDDIARLQILSKNIRQSPQGLFMDANGTYIDGDIAQRTLVASHPRAYLLDAKKTEAAQKFVKAGDELSFGIMDKYQKAEFEMLQPLHESHMEATGGTEKWTLGSYQKYLAKRLALSAELREVADKHGRLPFDPDAEVHMDTPTTVVENVSDEPANEAEEAGAVALTEKVQLEITAAADADETEAVVDNVSSFGRHRAPKDRSKDGPDQLPGAGKHKAEASAQEDIEPNAEQETKRIRAKRFAGTVLLRSAVTTQMASQRLADYLADDEKGDRRRSTVVRSVGAAGIAIAGVKLKP
jgi:hypothetical protein